MVLTAGVPPLIHTLLFSEQVEALEALLGRMHSRTGSTEKRGSIPLVTLTLFSLIYKVDVLNRYKYITLMLQGCLICIMIYLFTTFCLDNVNL